MVVLYNSSKHNYVATYLLHEIFEGLIWRSERK